MQAANGLSILTQQEYIEKRLKDQIGWYGGKSSWNKKRYELFKKIELAMAAMIPFLVGFLEGPLFLKIVIGVLGASLAFFGGLHGLCNYHENWIEYRMTAEILKHELYLFETGTGPYKDTEATFKILVERTESIISHENVNWGQFCNRQKKEESS